MKKIVLGLVIATLCCSFASAENILVAFQHIPTKKHPKVYSTYPLWSLQSYGIKLKGYNYKDYENGFLDDLKKAKIMVFAGGSGYEFRHILKDGKVSQGFKDFFAGGGVVFCEFGGLPLYRSSEIKKGFYDFLKLTPPTSKRIRGIEYLPLKDTNEDIMSKPHDIIKNYNLKIKQGKKFYRGTNGYFTDLQSGQKIILADEKDPAKGILIIQHGIEGKGTIIYSMMRKLPVGLIENLLTKYYGKLQKGIAATIPVKKRGLMPGKPQASSNSKSDNTAGGLPNTGLSVIYETKLPVKNINPLFLVNLKKKSWTLQQWKHRFPLVAFSKLDKYKRRTVAFTRKFPAGVKAESIRVVTPHGLDIPCQVQLVNKDDNTLKVLFLDKFMPYQNKCYFVYFSDSKVPKKAFADTVLSIKKQGEYYVMRNANIEAKFFANHPFINYFGKPGDVYGNRFEDSLGLSPGFGVRAYSKRPEVISCKVIADGPVRKILRYRVKYLKYEFNMDYILDAASNQLNYQFSSNKKFSITREARWNPGRAYDSTKSDILYVCAKSGLKSFKTAAASRLATFKKGQLKEGWYAFQDTETGHTIGEIFDPENIRNIGFSYYTLKGLLYIATIEIKNTCGAFINSDNAGILGVRDEYKAFKTPPDAIVGKMQNRNEISAKPELPVFTKNQIRMLRYPIRTRQAPYWGYYDPIRSTCEMIPQLQDQGYNGFFSITSASPYKNTVFKKDFTSDCDYLPRMVKLSHEKGMLFGSALTQMRSTLWYQKSILDKIQLIGKRHVDHLEVLNHLKQGAREVAATGVDFVELQDEQVYRLYRGNEKLIYGAKLFKEKYGYEPPQINRNDYSKFKQPSWHNSVFFNMDAWTKIITSMAKAANEVNPKGIYFDQVNVSAMARLGGAPHDWEVQAGKIDNICMDLYGAPNKMYKYFGKLMNAMNNHKKPHLIVAGCVTKSKDIIANIGYNMMWWTGMLSVFPHRGFNYTNWYNEVERLFQMLEYTGLGDLMVMPPKKRIAVLWDRSAMIDCIKKGEWERVSSLYGTRVMNYIYINSLSTDIVMSRFFNAEKLKDYKFLIVSNNPVLSDKLAFEIKKYVETGGTVFIEGESIKNSIISKLCGVEKATDKMLAAKCTGQDFDFQGMAMKVKNKNAKVLENFGNLAVYSRKEGKGTVIYSPMILGNAMENSATVAWFRKLVNSKAGKPVIEFNPEAYEQLESNIMTDGENYLLMVFNQESNDIDFSIKCAGSFQPTSIVDFCNGKIQKFNGEYSDRIKGGRLQYYLLTKNSKDFKIPGLKSTDIDSDSVYSISPGKGIMEFKKIAVASTGGSANIRKRDRRPGIIYVGILSDKGREHSLPMRWIRGDEAIQNQLSKQKNIQAELIPDLSAARLKNYDVVIVPNYNQSGLQHIKIQGGWEKRLRDFANNGGGVMLLHRSTGYSCSEIPFPAIGKNAIQTVSTITNFNVTSDHPVINAECIFRKFPGDAKNPAFQTQMDVLKMKTGEAFSTGTFDHIPLKKGPKGQVLAVSQMDDKGRGGSAVLIAGKYGKGKVVLCGTAIGDSCIKSQGKKKFLEKITSGEKKILINSVYWLSEKK